MITKEEFERSGYKFDSDEGRWMKTIQSASKMVELYTISILDSPYYIVSTNLCKPEGLGTLLLKVIFRVEEGMDCYRIEEVLAEMYRSLECVPLEDLCPY